MPAGEEAVVGWGILDRWLFRKHLFEAAILTFSGALAGLLLGMATSVSVSLIAGWPTRVSAVAVGMALVMSLAVGFASGLYPALKAASADVSVALRSS
jgi:ABC-type antimicrobial peptide transport system permease subunit